MVVMSSQSVSQSELNASVPLRDQSASKTRSKRIICTATVRKHICTTIPTEARFDLLIRFRIYCNPECQNVSFVRQQFGNIYVRQYQLRPDLIY